MPLNLIQSREYSKVKFESEAWQSINMYSAR